MMTSSQMLLTAGEPERRWWILAVLATAQLMVALDATVVSIALPHANHQDRPQTDPQPKSRRTAHQPAPS